MKYRTIGIVCLTTAWQKTKSKTYAQRNAVLSIDFIFTKHEF